MFGNLDDVINLVLNQPYENMESKHDDTKQPLNNVLEHQIKKLFENLSKTEAPKEASESPKRKVFKFEAPRAPVPPNLPPPPTLKPMAPIPSTLKPLAPFGLKDTLKVRVANDSKNFTYVVDVLVGHCDKNSIHVSYDPLPNRKFELKIVCNSMLNSDLVYLINELPAMERRIELDYPLDTSRKSVMNLADGMLHLEIPYLVSSTVGRTFTFNE